MRTEIILFTPRELGEWAGNFALDIPEVTAVLLKGEFFGSKSITIDPKECEDSIIKHYLFSKN